MSAKPKCILILFGIILIMASFMYNANDELRAAQDDIQMAGQAIDKTLSNIEHSKDVLNTLRGELADLDQENERLKKIHQEAIKTQSDNKIQRDSIFYKIEKEQKELVHRRNLIISKLEASKILSND